MKLKADNEIVNEIEGKGVQCVEVFPKTLQILAFVNISVHSNVSNNTRRVIIPLPAIRKNQSNKNCKAKLHTPLNQTTCKQILH